MSTIRTDLGVFSYNNAKYFCSKQMAPNGPARGWQAFVRDFRRGRSDIKEGDPKFEEYRTALLQETERFALLSAIQYARGLTLLSGTSAHWALVTLYYGSFFGANAI